MSKRDEMLREILNDPELLAKYNLREKDIQELNISGPYQNKAVEVLATVIKENDNGRTSRQIYPVIKNIHKI